MFYLIRHTKPDVEPTMCYGQSDLDVADSFEREKNEIKELLPEKFEGEIFCSPLIRCRKLAEALFPNKPITFDDRIKEIYAGDWEMIPWDSIDKEFLKHWKRNFITEGIPNGECHGDFFDRVQEFFGELDIKNKDYAVVAHDGVLRGILIDVLKMPRESAYAIDLNYGATIECVLDDWADVKVKFLR
ncbi:phosphoglycerate mutase [Puteibacter caeruleilacunae]|nr:phosphoglycerate mutase [Puteibacter caeruleilacunae]